MEHTRQTKQVFVYHSIAQQPLENLLQINDYIVGFFNRA